MRLVFVIGVVSLLTDVHSETILAVLPVFVAETLHGGALAVGLMEGVADLAASALRIWAGRRSDRADRRKPWVVAGYSLSVLAKAAMALAQAAGAALGVRVIDRVGKGIRSAPRDAMIADAVPPARRGAAFGLHRAMDTTGAVIGSALAFVLLSHSIAMRTIMLWAAIPGVAALVVLALALREWPPALRAAEAPASVPAADRQPLRVRTFLAVEGLFGLSYASYAFFLLRARELGAAITLLPLLYLAYNVVYAALPWPLGRLSDRFGRHRLLAVGYAAFAFACLAAAKASAVDGWLWASFGLFGIASAIVESAPRAIVAESLGSARRGSALGLHYSVVGVSAVASGVLYGSLWDSVGSRTLFAAAAVAPAAALVLLPLTLQRR